MGDSTMRYVYLSLVFGLSMPNRDEQLRKAAEIIAGDTSNKTQVHWYMEQLRTEKGGTAWGFGHSELDMNLTNQLLAPYETCYCFNKKSPATVVENRYSVSCMAHILQCRIESLDVTVWGGRLLGRQHANKGCPGKVSPLPFERCMRFYMRF